MIAAVGLNSIRRKSHEGIGICCIVQGFLTPPLMLLIMLMTNSPFIMGDKRNSLLINLFGWFTTLVIFAASLALLWSWIAGKTVSISEDRRLLKERLHTSGLRGFMGPRVLR